MPSHGTSAAAGHQVPHSHRPVICTAADGVTAVPRDADSIHSVLARHVEGVRGLVAQGLPHEQGTVDRSRDDVPAIRRHCHGTHRTGMPLKCVYGLAGGQVPDVRASHPGSRTPRSDRPASRLRRVRHQCVRSACGRASLAQCTGSAYRQMCTRQGVQQGARSLRQPLIAEQHGAFEPLLAKPDRIVLRLPGEEGMALLPQRPQQHTASGQ